MYIKKLTIKNYRNFGDPAFTIDLEPFTLILGENNIGKTNLLDALGLIFSQEITVFKKRILEIDDIHYQTIQKFKAAVLDGNIDPKYIEFPIVSVEVLLTRMNEEQDRVVADWFIDKELSEAKITYRFEPRLSFDKVEWIEEQRSLISQEERREEQDASDSGSRAEARDKRETAISGDEIDFPITQYRYALFGGNDPTNQCDLYFLRMMKMEFLDALRDAQKELVASGEFRLLHRILNQQEDSKYGDIKQILRRLKRVIDENKSLGTVKTQIIELLTKVSLQSSDDENKVDFLFSSPETSELLKKIGLIYGKTPVSVARNGLGRNNLLYISLVLSHLSSKDTRGGDTYFRIIGIEEPEAHLHPHLQDHLAKNLEGIVQGREDMQLLLTSHSTDIAAKLDLKNTCVLFGEQNGTIKSHYVLSGIDEESERQSIHYLARHIDATKSRMFFARKIILVEGIAEQLLIPRLFECHFGDPLEQRGYNIVNVSGVAFEHFLKIIEAGYFIRCLVLTDSDLDTESYQRAPNLKEVHDKDKLVRVEISTESTFERDLIMANRSGEGRATLLRALKLTRPRKGKLYADDLGEGDIDVRRFFNLIEKHKAEFAFNLAADLNLGNISMPLYIERGFDFLED